MNSKYDDPIVTDNGDITPASRALSSKLSPSGVYSPARRYPND
jgi:hypothetical protein